MAAADGNSQAVAAKRRRALPGKTTQGSAKKQKGATTKKAAAHPVQQVSAPAQPVAVLIKTEPAEAAPARMPRRPARGEADAASSQLPATGSAAAPATPAQRDSLLNGAHGEQGEPSLPWQAAVVGIQGSYLKLKARYLHAVAWILHADSLNMKDCCSGACRQGTPTAMSKMVSFEHAGRSSSRSARRSANAQQPASASKDAAGPVPSVNAATLAAEARPADAAARGVATAEMAELQVRKMSCRTRFGIGNDIIRGTPHTKVSPTGTRLCKVPF